MDQTLMNQIVSQVTARLTKLSVEDEVETGIPVGISNRHIHLCMSDCEKLFGWDHGLTRKKDLKQLGEFAAEETVTLVGKKGVLQGVRVLGPLRSVTQVEISRTDAFALGVNSPLRDSGELAKSAGIAVVGPCGAINLPEGVICASRHIHMHTDDGKRFGVSDQDHVMVEAQGPRGCIFKNVLVRVGPTFSLEFHIDTDEANAAQLKNGDHVRLLQCKER